MPARKHLKTISDNRQVMIAGMFGLTKDSNPQKSAEDDADAIDCTDAENISSLSVFPECPIWFHDPGHCVRFMYNEQDRMSDSSAVVRTKCPIEVEKNVHHCWHL